jgi:hypothetical protein
MPERKLSILRGLYDQAMNEYEADTAAVHAVTSSREGTKELASMTVVANALLNLDEVVMKE